MSGMNSTARALGVDPGSTRMGLALADDLGLMAHPYQTLQVKGVGPADQAAAIASVAAEKDSPSSILQDWLDGNQVF